jgi:N-acetylmuramic acid 6-phosphate etherase
LNLKFPEEYHAKDIAGKAVEFAEDDAEQGWKELEKYKINSNDVVIGIAASGKTPYVIGALKACKKNKIVTGGITCNPESELEKTARICIVIPTGAEFVTGSTRMKAGTAQKLVLNMISTSVMIRLGKVKGNKMVDMQLTNNKLIKRGVQMLMDELKIIQLEAEELLKKYGSVRKALQAKK